jgi:hypothetical protein
VLIGAYKRLEEKNIVVYWISLLGITLMLSACGKKGPVEPLEPDQYPRPYPKPIPIERE